MEGILIIIAIVVISSILSATKKKPARKDEGEQPVRPTMSDIQKAFMMMGDPEHSQQHTPPKRNDGLPGREGIFRENLPRREGVYNRLEEHELEGTLGREGTGSLEGTAGREGMPGVEGAFAASTVSAPPNKYANVRIDKYFADEEEDSTPSVRRIEGIPALRLFENQSDFAKAVIYSEILTRKTQKRHV